MPVTRLSGGTREFDLFARMLREGAQREPEDFGAGLPGSGTEVMGLVENGRLLAFAIFQPYMDPSLHLGGMVDPEFVGRLDDLGDTALYNISLIHSASAEGSLGAQARALIEAFAEMLLGSHESYGLLISLFRKGNRRAVGNYRSMGFRRRGGESYFMDVDPNEIIAKYGRAGKREGTIFLKTFAEAGEADMASLARCYRTVFMRGVEVDVRQHLARIAAAPSFLKDLSVLVTDEAHGGEVVGFCFIERGGPETVYVHAAGMSQDLRGSGVAMRSFSWIMENCLGRGVKRVTLVTASKKLRDVFGKIICATLRDTLVWYIRCGVRDE
jgi:hypothetical protein